MKKIYLLLFVAMFGNFAKAQQQILLMTESFASGTNTFEFDSGGVGSNAGNNQWIINDQYNGTPLYPNTPNEDSVVSGTINGAPYSYYLHIHDSVGALTGVANDNWNNLTGSDRFTYIKSPFCTLGMTNVIFTFFWICEGDTNNTAYGAVYYRIDGGPWIQTGQPKYNNQSKWKYEVIQDPAFNNAQNVQLGFRWVNPVSATPSRVSFGIDDIIAVGTYDSAGVNPVHISITLISPDSVCQGDYVLIGYKLSAPMCDATYQIQMSNSVGSFAVPVNGGIFTIFAPDTTGYTAFAVPTNVSGNCFRIRINRVSPPPFITGDTSICFNIHVCPVSIITNNAPVMNDFDTTCIKSAIDVKFNSFGVFAVNNVYTAQLSDSNGSFANPFFLGSLPSSMSYPGFPPGNVSGLIPATVPPGCGYYIRIISSSPAAIGTVIGPFCLTQCDVTTNNTVDLHFCINYPNATDSAILHIGPGQWNNSANSYDTCNNWTIELLDMMTFNVVNIGGLGIYHDSIGGDFLLIVGPLSSLPVAPGSYYMRILSNCGNQPWDTTGTVIRITIGAPASMPPDIISPDSVVCNSGIVNLYINPDNPNSQYEWSSNILNNGNAFIWPYNPLSIDMTGAQPNPDAVFYVREINYGCYGPYSAAAHIAITTIPNVSISGDTTVCIGDTVTYNVGYLPATYYNWDAPPGVQILIEGNSQVSMVFDSIGTFTISNFSLNKCGGDSGFYTVNVRQLFNVNIGPDTTICTGLPLSLDAQTNPLNKLFQTQANSTQKKQGAMFNLISHYDVTIDSFAVRYDAISPIQAEIYGKSGTYQGFEQAPLSWSQLGSFYNFIPHPVGQWTVIPIQLNHQIAAGDTFAFYVTTANSPAINQYYTNGTGAQGTLFRSDGVIDFIQGTVNNYLFGTYTPVNGKVVDIRIWYSTKAGLHYHWSMGDTTEFANFTPSQAGLYSVIVADTSGCQSRDTMRITLKTSPAVNAGPDTALCNGDSIILQGSSSVPIIIWAPGTGLNNVNILNPTFDYNQSMMYVLSATDTGNGCSWADTIIITINGIQGVYAGPDIGLCSGDTIMIGAVEPTSIVNLTWSPATGLSDSTVAQPIFSNLQTVVYVLSGTDSNGCKSKDTLSVIVAPKPSVFAGPDTSICNGQAYTMPASTSAQNILWTPATDLSDSSIINPVFTGMQASTYILMVSDNHNCRNSDTVSISVNPIPTVNAGSDTTICSNTPYLMAAASSAQNFQWIPSSGLSDPAILNPVFNYTQSIDYILIVTDNSQCSNRDSVTIHIAPSIYVNAGPDTVICPGETVVLQGATSAAIFMWSPGTGLSDSTILNPTYDNNTQSGEYVLIAIDSGCVAVDTVKIDMGPCAGYIKPPQAFAPGGSGDNSHFTVFGKNVAQYEIRIFNRWGELVYESRDASELNDHSRGWDGTYKGKLQETGTFVYFISAKDDIGKTLDTKGNLTLIR